MNTLKIICQFNVKQDLAALEDWEKQWQKNV
jgi:hypothetical protein